MKLPQLAALALLAAVATTASAASFTVDFENTWAYGADVNGYYNGGSADDGSSGANLGVSFTGVTGLSNTADFTYYAGAPSLQGVAYAHTSAATDRLPPNQGKGETSALNTQPQP